ncbi:hypothetical protein J7384_17905 [Endozoicomonas sp. G2_1]|uniref:hypothetical protein n=1 Tax=Endozoicomonas sp. G2_1 TaxID=2821091 RepID=UPI001ADCF015|nr:hypothetical protein [Endozoicomonas sp. G2_1]MBO9492241.1 hypothetical protein [Endozoicomonas sp. G2_1]
MLVFTQIEFFQVFMLIAIVGVFDKQSVVQEVVRQLKEAASYSVCHWTVGNKCRKGRRTTLKTINQSFHKQVLLIEPIIFSNEADFVRQKGGFIWHVAECLSSDIPILKGDIMVSITDDHKAFGTIESGYHQCMLRQSSKRGLPKPGVDYRE